MILVQNYYFFLNTNNITLKDFDYVQVSMCLR
jgi:hypothetical protein